jgi:hypothetical protein
MRILTSAAVFGLVPVPPQYGDQLGKDCSLERFDGADPAPQDASESTPPETPLVCAKLGRALRWLVGILPGVFALAQVAGPAGAASPRGALKPVTFGMDAGRAASALLTKTALTVTSAPKTSPVKPGDVVIDVIVAYTAKAASHYADIERELVALSLEEANQSFRASNLGHIKLRLVHTYRTGYVEQGMHFDHVWRFADKSDGEMEEIHGLRDHYGADVAILILDDAKGCGLATRVGADADEAFAVVHHECAAASYSLAHEVGHLIGARHELGFVNGTKWRDIMGYKGDCGGCQRVAVWSSPTVLVNGEPAGTEELNNARIIAEQASRVAAFR